MEIRRRLANVIPLQLKWRLKSIMQYGALGVAYLYDMRRFARYASTASHTRHRNNLRAAIVERYHSIEKGLSLPEPRPFFGMKPLGDLIHNLPVYLERYGEDAVTRHAMGAITAYIEFHNRIGVGDDPRLPHRDKLVKLIAEAEHNESSGVERVRRSEIHRTVENVGLDFFASRHSTRQFTNERVDREDVEWVVRAAQESPAVCNRQFTRAHVYLNDHDISRILDIQGGARGFADQIRGLAVITTSARTYWNASQRNQGWVDGGLFSMTFLLGLHARGLGGVALNWSKGPAIDRRLREELGFGNDEMIVMLVGFGYLRESYSVASSPRVPTAEILDLHE